MIVTSSPGIQCAEEEDDQPHNALGIPPLCLDAGGAGGSDCCRPAADQYSTDSGYIYDLCTDKSNATNEKQVIYEHNIAYTLKQIVILLLILHMLPGLLSTGCELSRSN